MKLDVVMDKEFKQYCLRVDEVPFLYADKLDHANNLKDQLSSMFIKHGRRSRDNFKNEAIQALRNAKELAATEIIRKLN